jgi:hypothetical protein
MLLAVSRRHAADPGLVFADGSPYDMLVRRVYCDTKIYRKRLVLRTYKKKFKVLITFLAPHHIMSRPSTIRDLATAVSPLVGWPQ